MTRLTAPVDGEATGGLWLSVSALAAAKGISKQAVSKRLDRFAAEGNPVSTRLGPKGSKLVNVAEYDRIAGEIGDTLRTAFIEPLKPVEDEPTSSSVLTTERARREGYAAELARLELEERQGLLLPRSEVEAAMRRCAEALVRGIDSLHTRTGDIITACDAGREAAVRSILKEISYGLRSLLAREMRLMAAGDEDVGEPTAAA